MTANRKIILNVAATYGRSLYGMVCGLFTARWVLLTLGEVDYGLIGVVGGLVGFISILNGLMASAVSRFYAFSVGKAESSGHSESALEECRRWFNTAVFLHTAIAIVSMSVGYPIGEWAVKNFLTIPPERVEACVWVFRITCVTCFTSMALVPYRAMYNAKQEISELTLYGFVTTTLNVGILYYMVSHPSDWLVRYACWMSAMSVIPSCIITVRSFVKYAECRYVPRYMIDMHRMKELFRYAGLKFISSMSLMLSFQGMTVLVNKMLGPARNAAMTVGNHVASQVLSLTTAFITAMGPAITNATGAGDRERVRALARRADVYASLFVAIFAIPLCLEIDLVFRLWLKNPPQQATTLCLLILTAKFISQMTTGEFLSLMALRDIGKLQICDSVAYLIPFVSALAFFGMGGGLEGVGVGFITLYICSNGFKLYLARKQCGLKIREWGKRVMMPLCGCVAVTIGIGSLPSIFMPGSFPRIIVTGLVSEFTLGVLAWCFILETADKRKMMSKILHR